RRSGAKYGGSRPLQAVEQCGDRHPERAGEADDDARAGVAALVLDRADLTPVGHRRALAELVLRQSAILAEAAQVPGHGLLGVVLHRADRPVCSALTPGLFSP